MRYGMTVTFRLSDIAVLCPNTGYIKLVFFSVHINPVKPSGNYMSQLP
jgi:hypothetical protein